MKVADLRELVLLLSEKSIEIKATPAAFLAAFVRCLFAYKHLTDAQVARICNVSTRTLTQHANQIYDLLGVVYEFEELFYYEDKCENEGKVSPKDADEWERSGIGQVTMVEGRGPFVKLGKKRFLNSKGEIVANCNTPVRKKRVKKEGDVSNCNNSVEPVALGANLGGQNVVQNDAKSCNLHRVTSNLCNNPQNSLVECEREEREKGSPRTPFIEREERKVLSRVSPPNPPEGELGCARDLNFCSNKLQANATRPQSNPQSKSKPSSQSVRRHEPLRYPAHFEAFLRDYPNHGAHGEMAKSYRMMLMRWWRDCEDEGYTGDDILEIYEELSKDFGWDEADGAYTPGAWNFLASYVYLCEPSGSPNEFALARLEKVDPALVAFCENYPKRSHPGSRAMIKVWKQCVKKGGCTPEEINLCLKWFMRAGNWEEERFIPQADTWLRNKQYQCVLAYVRDLQCTPRGRGASEDRPGAKDPTSFNYFCCLYPKKMAEPLTEAHHRVWEAWCRLEEFGFTGEALVKALQAALKSDCWAVERGRYIPKPEKFLCEGWIERFTPWPKRSK